MNEQTATIYSLEQAFSGGRHVVDNTETPRPDCRAAQYIECVRGFDAKTLIAERWLADLPAQPDPARVYVYLGQPR